MGCIGAEQRGNVVAQLVFCGGLEHGRCLLLLLLYDLNFARASSGLRGWFFLRSCFRTSAFFFGRLLYIFYYWLGSGWGRRWGLPSRPLRVLLWSLLLLLFFFFFFFIVAAGCLFSRCLTKLATRSGLEGITFFNFFNGNHLFNNRE